MLIGRYKGPYTLTQYTVGILKIIRMKPASIRLVLYVINELRYKICHCYSLKESFLLISFQYMHLAIHDSGI